MCTAAKHGEKFTKTLYFEVQGRSRSICNSFHAKQANCGKSDCVRVSLFDAIVLGEFFHPAATVCIFVAENKGSPQWRVCGPNLIGLDGVTDRHTDVRLDGSQEALSIAVARKQRNSSATKKVFRMRNNCSWIQVFLHVFANLQKNLQNNCTANVRMRDPNLYPAESHRIASQMWSAHLRRSCILSLRLPYLRR